MVVTVWKLSRHCARSFHPVLLWLRSGLSMPSLLPPLVFIHGFKGSGLTRPQGREAWLTRWQVLGVESPDLTLPIHWDDDGQQRDDLVATSPLRHVAGWDVYASFLKWAEASGRAFYPFAYDW